MLLKPEMGWAIVDAQTDKLLLVDGRFPLFWLRKVAVEFAAERGFVTAGHNKTARICKVVVKQSA